LPYDHLVAWAISPQGTTCVATFTLTQAIVSGTGLNGFYQALGEHRIRRVQATSLANGQPYSIPVVPMTTLMARRNESLTDAHPLLVDVVPMDGNEEAPAIAKVQLVDLEDWHFGAKGDYVSDEGR
jgi:hypothetical protein